MSNFAQFSFDNTLLPAGTTQGSGPLVTSTINFISHASTANTSLSLPPAVPGLLLAVINAASGQTLLLFPQVGEATNGTVNAAISIPNNNGAICFCGLNGQWWAK